MAKQPVSIEEHLRQLLALAARQGASGEHAGAVAAYREAAALQPGNPRIWCNFGVALNEIGLPSEAEAAYRRAIELDARFTHAWYNLGLLQQKSGTAAEAELCYRSAAAMVDALSDRTLWALIYRNLGLLLYGQGRIREAVAWYYEALSVHPDEIHLRSNLLFTLNYLPGICPREMREEHVAWGALNVQQSFKRSGVEDGARKIKLGYVSADFFNHALAYFVRPVLANHDHSEFQVVCYNNGATSDATTEVMRRSVDLWRDTRDWSDDLLAEKVRSDGIDILIDVSGHTSGNRLLAFARKPAPIQIGYLGYFNTTGLHAIDYRISDAYVDPPGTSDRMHTEKILRLPDTLWCFQPHPESPAVSTLPSLERGYVTFGSFNNIAKVGDRVLQLWAQLLHLLPNARLTLLNVPDEGVAARIMDGFVGIDSSRITLGGRFDRSQYWHQFADVDIALDPFPYNGGATTCESLWMGVPVVALAGDYGFSRISASILMNLGLEHLLAQCAEEYVEVAASLAADLASLSRLRHSLRDRMLDSPLLDAPGYTRALEDAYRRVWGEWCAQSDGGDA